MVDGWSSEDGRAALPYTADDTGLGSDDSVVSDLDMSDYADLACYDAVLSDLGGACDAGLSRHDGIFAYLHVVGNLAEVVDLHALANDGGLHFSAVDSGVGTDFDIVMYYHFAKVLDLLPRTVFLRSVAEAVRADYAVGVEYDIVADLHSRVDAYSRIDDAVLSYRSAVSDVNVFIDFCALTDPAVLADVGEVADIDILADLGGESDVAMQPAMAAVALLLV